jgi:predicted esterase
MKLPLSHLWFPARTPSKQLVVVLHGLGDSAKGFLWLQDAGDRFAELSPA